MLAVQALGALPQVDPARIFVLGHSQGGMMAPRIAAHAADADAPVAGLVLFAAPSRKLLDILVEQTRRLAVLDDGHTSDEEAATLATLRRQVKAVREGGDRGNGVGVRADLHVAGEDAVGLRPTRP